MSKSNFIKPVLHEDCNDCCDEPHPSLEVFIEGMSTCCKGIDGGAGSPVYLEHFEGKWTLLVWSNINEENPTHRIDLSGAMENKRNEEYRSNARKV